MRARVISTLATGAIPPILAAVWVLFGEIAFWALFTGVVFAAWNYFAPWWDRS